MAYVETEKVLETARDGYHSDFGRSMADLTSLREVLEDTPTVDVVEVKHGMWINTDSFDTNYQPIYQCSVCNKEIADEFVSCHKYCLHCGAKMDKRSEDK